MTKFDRAAAMEGNLLVCLNKFAQGVTVARGGVRGARSCSAERSARARLAAAQNSASDGLVEAAVSFLDSLPLDVRSTVLNNFAERDVSPSEMTVAAADDAFGRAFPARAAWCKRLRLDRRAITSLHALPEDVQRIVVRDFDPNAYEGNVSDALRMFCHVVMSRYSANSQLSSSGPVVATPLRSRTLARQLSRQGLLGTGFQMAPPVLTWRPVRDARFRTREEGARPQPREAEETQAQATYGAPDMAKSSSYTPRQWTPLRQASPTSSAKTLPSHRGAGSEVKRSPLSWRHT